MLWIVVLLLCFLPTVESERCDESDSIVGRLGHELVLRFPLSDLRDEYNDNLAEWFGEIQIQDLTKKLVLSYDNNMYFEEQVIFKDGSLTDHWSSNRTEIFVTNDAFVVKKTKLQREDVGRYWIKFNSHRLGRKTLLMPVESEEIIVGRLGEELVFNFPLSDLRDEYNKYIPERGGRNKIRIQDLTNRSLKLFKNDMDYDWRITLYNGKPTDSAGNHTEIFMTNDALVVKKTELQKEDAGVYWVEFDRYIPFRIFRSIYLGMKALIIAGKPIIKGRPQPHSILKAKDSTILQLECHSVSTSIGNCQLVYNSMYIMWYKNGMRMTELDPTLSQINVTVDHYGGSFTCLATEYQPCYHRLQTTKHYDGLNCEVCDNLYASETFLVKPHYALIDIKLEPDQREITVNKNEDLKVRCLAKCHSKCDVKWEKDLQDLKSSGLVTITESMFGNYLKIVNISSSDEGLYSCLVNNTHGERRNNFILSVRYEGMKADTGPTLESRVRETETKLLVSAEMITIIVAVTVVIVINVFVIVIVIVVIKYKKCYKEKTDYVTDVPEEGIYETIDEFLSETSEENNSRNGEQNQEPETVRYDVTGCPTPNVYTKLTNIPKDRYPEILNKIVNKSLDLQ